MSQKQTINDISRPLHDVHVSARLISGESIGTTNSLVTSSNPLVSPDGLVVLAQDLKSGVIVKYTSLYKSDIKPQQFISFN